MLRSTTRRALSLVPLPATGKRHGVGKLHHQLLAFYFNSGVLGVADGVNDENLALNVAEKGNQKHWKMSAWEEEMLAGLRSYKEKNGDLLVPNAFTVPVDDTSWPRTVWGYQLGKSVQHLRIKLKAGTLSVKMREELENMQFVSDVFHFNWDHIVLPTLRQFQKVYGHTDVPYRFVVPEGDEAWPKLAWGKRFGNTALRLRSGSWSKQMAKTREELDFNYQFSVHEHDWTEKILPSLKIHYQQFGHCIVRHAFKVPSTYPWPEKAWGFPLGKCATDFRIGKTGLELGGKTYVEQAVRDKDILESIGFAWNYTSAVWEQKILASIQVFAQVFNHGRIPLKFVVPSEDPWPRAAWNTNLGGTLRRMRGQGAYFRFYGRDADLLDEVGVNMKLSRQAWEERVVPLLDIYATLHDGKEIPESFVISSEAPWPEKMWGSSSWAHCGSQFSHGEVAITNSKNVNAIHVDGSDKRSNQI